MFEIKIRFTKFVNKNDVDVKKVEEIRGLTSTIYYMYKQNQVLANKIIKNRKQEIGKVCTENVSQTECKQSSSEEFSKPSTSRPSLEITNILVQENENENSSSDQTVSDVINQQLNNIKSSNSLSSASDSSELRTLATSFERLVKIEDNNNVIENPVIMAEFNRSFYKDIPEFKRDVRELPRFILLVTRMHDTLREQDRPVLFEKLGNKLFGRASICIQKTWGTWGTLKVELKSRFLVQRDPAVLGNSKE